MRTDDVTYESFSGWVDPPTDLRRPVEGEVAARVAVVGGGIGGMSTALRLAQRGQDVVLVEAEFCGHGSSSRNAGQLAGAPGGDLQLINLLARKRMPAMMRLAENAAHHVEDFIAKHDIDCEYDATGNAFAAVSRGQMGRVRRVAKIITRAGGHVEVGTAAELGIPRGFVGGMREVVGGRMNPGRFSLGMRRVLLDSTARVFEQTKVTDVVREGGQVVLSTPGGRVRADHVVLATNAFAGEWDITPRHLSVPIYVVEVETEPVDPARIAALGWTSGMGLVTQHAIMENYRLTPRNTIVFGVRRLERGTSYRSRRGRRTPGSSRSSPAPSRAASPPSPTSRSSGRGAGGSPSRPRGCRWPAGSATTSPTPSPATVTGSPRRRTSARSSRTRSSTACATRTCRRCGTTSRASRGR